MTNFLLLIVFPFAITQATGKPRPVALPATIKSGTIPSFWA
tara:strand:- start:1783 stop:1905 length:123 start_codon:yes stop_codon:yes gene_type:complete